MQNTVLKQPKQEVYDMKEKFSHYYKLSDHDLTALWKESFFVFDTNSLLNLYRYSTKTRDTWFEVFRKIQSRVFLPYQVGEEYHRNRLNVIHDERSVHQELVNKCEKNLNLLISEIEKVKRFKEEIDTFKSSLDSFSLQLKTATREYPDYTSLDPIINFLNEIFLDKAGEDYSDVDLKKIFTAGAIRYKEKRPPGFMDEDKKDSFRDTQKFGDLLIWNQILDFAKKENKSIILITDDSKEDWWLKKDRKTLGPHPELIKEFGEVTKKRYYQYSSSSFLELSQRFLSTKIEKATLEETSEVQNSKHPYFIRRIGNSNPDITQEFIIPDSFREYIAQNKFELELKDQYNKYLEQNRELHLSLKQKTIMDEIVEKYFNKINLKKDVEDE